MLNINMKNILNKSIFLCFLLYSMFFLFDESIGYFFIRIAFLLGLIKFIKYKNIYFDLNVLNKYLKPFLVFGLIIIILLFLHGLEYSSVSRYERLIKIMIPFFTGILFISDKKQMIWIIILLFFSIIINDIYSIYDYFFQKNNRTYGINMGSLYFAGILLLQIPILLCALKIENISQKKKCIILSVLFLTLVTIFTNGSRMTWFIVIIDFIIFNILFIKSYLKKILIFLGIILVLFSLYNISSNINSKVNNLFDVNNISTRGHYFYLRDGFNLFLEHKVIGVGLDNFKEQILNDNLVSEESLINLKKDLHEKIDDKYVMPHAHNDLVMFLSELGILGGFIYIYLFGSILIYTFNNWQISKDLWSLSMFLITINILIRGLSDYNFANIGVISLYFFIYSLYLIYIFLSSDKNREKIKSKYIIFIYGIILFIILLRIISRYVIN